MVSDQNGVSLLYVSCLRYTILVGNPRFLSYGSSSGRSTDLRDKNFNFEHSTQTFQPNVFIPAVHMGTIYRSHFVSLSVTLTLAVGHKVSAKQNLFSTDHDEI